MIKKILVAGVLTLSPLVTFAAFGQTKLLVDDFYGLMTTLTNIALAVAFLVFVWGIARFIYALNKGDEQTVTAGRTFMVWSIIALFVMVSIWGIVGFISGDILGVGKGGGVNYLQNTSGSNSLQNAGDASLDLNGENQVTNRTSA